MIYSIGAPIFSDIHHPLLLRLLCICFYRLADCPDFEGNYISLREQTLQEINQLSQANFNLL
jgi:hypothetical protein